MEFMRQFMYIRGDLRGNLRDVVETQSGIRRKSVYLLLKFIQTYVEEGHSLAQVIMQFPSDASAFFFVCLDQVSADIEERFLGSFAVGDINRRSDIPLESAFSSEPRHADIIDPPILPIMPSEPVFQLKIVPCVKSLRIDFETSFQIFRMDRRSPAVSQF